MRLFFLTPSLISSINARIFILTNRQVVLMGLTNETDLTSKFYVWTVHCLSIEAVVEYKFWFISSPQIVAMLFNSILHYWLVRLRPHLPCVQISFRLFPKTLTNLHEQLARRQRFIRRRTAQEVVSCRVCINIGHNIVFYTWCNRIVISIICMYTVCMLARTVNKYWMYKYLFNIPDPI